MRIPVINKATGKQGTVEDWDFDPNQFTKVEPPPEPTGMQKVVGDVANAGGQALSGISNFLLGENLKKQIVDTPMAIGSMGLNYGKYKLAKNEQERQQAIIDYNKARQIAAGGEKTMGFNVDAPEGQSQLDPLQYAKGTTEGALTLASLLAPGAKEVKGAGLLKQTPRIISGAARGLASYAGRTGLDKLDPLNAALSTVTGSAGEVLVPKALEYAGKKLKDFGATILGRRFKFDIPNEDWLTKRQTLDKIIMEETTANSPEGIAAQIVGNKNPITGDVTPGLREPSRNAVRKAVEFADETLGLSTGNKKQFIPEDKLREQLLEGVKKELGYGPKEAIDVSTPEGRAFSKFFGKIIEKDPSIEGNQLTLKKMLSAMFDIGDETGKGFYGTPTDKQAVEKQVGKQIYFELRKIITKAVNDTAGVDIGELMARNNNFRIINEAMQNLASAHTHGGGLTREVAVGQSGLGSVLGDVGTAFNRALYNTGKMGEQALNNPFLRTLYGANLGNLVAPNKPEGESGQ